MPEVKFLGWIFYDITMLGIGGYTLSSGIDAFEKILLFVFASGFFWYRIANLREDNQKKKLDNEALRMDIEERRLLIEEKKIYLLNINNKKQTL